MATCNCIITCDSIGKVSECTSRPILQPLQYKFHRPKFVIHHGLDLEISAHDMIVKSQGFRLPELYSKLGVGLGLCCLE
eukprot:637933-Amorphochlora_amoeboformis.AAC.1